MIDCKISPLLKWAGGKRKLLGELIPRMPKEFNTYFEPFVGGGSVFLTIKPRTAVVNDINGELINVYQIVKENHKELIELLNKHRELHSSEYYYLMRNLDRDEKYNSMTKIEKAARIIYLNHTCYNGLYRVNKSGYYNTPIGRYKNPTICNEKNIKLASHYFNDGSIVFENSTYLDILKMARAGDFVYLDPPYDPVSTSASFTMYTKFGFGKEDQINLKKECDKLNALGVKFLQSNSDTPFIRELYSEYNIDTINVQRSINSKAEQRSGITEVLIYNYKVEV